MRTDGAGKGSAFVPEEFAFEKAGWHGRAVHLDQVPVSARAELVNRSRDHLLAGAGLSGDQDRCIRARQGRYLGGTVARLPVLSLDRRCCRNSACAQLPCVETSESIASAPLCCPFPAKCAHHGCLISRVQSIFASGQKRFIRRFISGDDFGSSDALVEGEYPLPR